MQQDSIAIKPDISLILPVYNVEKQLLRCLTSISNQTFSGTFEIIAVEASSTDASLTILREFEKTEPRLRIIEHGTREKLSTSRITGIAASKGDYILHVDSDDWLLPGALQRLFHTIQDTGADVIVFDFYRENDEGKKSSQKNVREIMLTSDKLKVQHYFFGACWNKFGKRILNENLVYGEVGATTTEDLPYSIEILLKASKIYLLPEAYYVYYLNTGSSSFDLKGEMYLKNQKIILQQLQSIFLKYSADREIVEKTLDYFEKWIYLELAKNHFWNKKNIDECINLVVDLYSLQVMTADRVERMNMSVGNRYFCLIEVAKRFGLKMCLGIIRRSF
jgi:glycosyltransferase involved in cell wall biosynthesis